MSFLQCLISGFMISPPGEHFAQHCTLRKGHCWLSAWLMWIMLLKVWSEDLYVDKKAAATHIPSVKHVGGRVFAASGSGPVTIPVNLEFILWKKQAGISQKEANQHEKLLKPNVQCWFLEMSSTCSYTSGSCVRILTKLHTCEKKTTTTIGDFELWPWTLTFDL